MKILYMPLDERPCNFLYPSRIAELAENVEIIVPPIEAMGKKKTPGNIEALWDFAFQEIIHCDAAVLSLDLLLYGGIVPSRLHSFTTEETKGRLNKLKELKRINPSVKLYAFNLITRLPNYSSSDEEPDYYEDYGREIFLYSHLTDKLEQQKITEQEQQEYEQLKKHIPERYLKDYIERRTINEEINHKAIKLTRDETIDFLVIPQDDCQPYGFPAITQRRLATLIREYELWDRVYIYPGADEVGCTLVTRAINAIKGRRPKIFIRHNSNIGINAIPSCEDRPLGESIKSQVSVCGGIIVFNEIDADYILFVNNPADVMKSIHEMDNPLDNAYERMRNMREMVDALEYYVDKGYACAVADIAYVNGGDSELVKLISKKKLYQRLYGYAAWNTCGNTLGTVLAHSMTAVMENRIHDARHQRFLLERFLEDWGYQSILRQQIVTEMLPELGLNYFTLGDQQDKITTFLRKEFQLLLDTRFTESKQYGLKIGRVYMPWNRMFEVGLEIDIE